MEETFLLCFLPSLASKLAAASLICMGHNTGKQGHFLLHHFLRINTLQKQLYLLKFRQKGKHNTTVHLIEMAANLGSWRNYRKTKPKYKLVLKGLHTVKKSVLGHPSIVTLFPLHLSPQTCTKPFATKVITCKGLPSHSNAIVLLKMHNVSDS